MLTFDKAAKLAACTRLRFRNQRAVANRYSTIPVDLPQRLCHNTGTIPADLNQGGR